MGDSLVDQYRYVVLCFTYRPVLTVSLILVRESSLEQSERERMNEAL